ncbi:4-coumarate--CoA ligase-like 7 [Trichoplax sp. H2]|nr:4-coumarate--CoA ligase-like 7 [Trichoplax sp. H2]|eukprot:RDD44758.1 4-coumarate--CoA ligase-like 7 [Trichoplax sp. H2]
MSSVRSPYPDVHIPDNVSFFEYVTGNFKNFGNKPAMTDGITGASYTFHQLDDAIKRVASALVKRGLKKGEVVAIISPNCIEWPVLFFAVISVGGIITTCNHGYKETELSSQLSNAGAVYLVAAKSSVRTVSKMRYKVRERFIIGDADGYTSYSELIRDDGSRFPSFVKINSKTDICVLPYSSGTTGVSKGVMISHYNLVANLEQTRPVRIRNRKNNCSLAVLPFYHIYGMVVIMSSCLRYGNHCVTLPGFEPKSFLRTIEKYKVARLSLVPPLALFLLKSPLVDKYDLSSLEDAGCGAAPLGDEVMQQFLRKMKVKRFVQGYGMTEASPTITLVSPDENHNLGSVGRPVPNTQCKFIDPDSGKVLPPNVPGEILVKGPQVMLGYLNRPKATAETIDKDGWLHTGDVGYYDENGICYIVDRIKELIKYKGYQVAPAELESLLKSHPDISDAAVIGIPDERAGEIPRAYIILKDSGNGKITTEKIQEYVTSKVAPHKRLRGGIAIVTEIPKSASGKILRRLIRDQYKKSIAKSKL